MAARIVYVLHVLRLLLVELAEHALGEHLGEADDRVERRAQLVGHVGEELRLVLARDRKLLALVLQLVEQSRVLNGQCRLGGEGFQQLDHVGREGTLFAAQHDQTTQQALLAQQWQSEHRTHALACQKRLHLGSDGSEFGFYVGDLHGLAGDAGAPDSALAEVNGCGPQRLQVFRCDSMSGPGMELLHALVELVDDAAVAVGQLDGSTYDGGEHGVEVESRAYGLTHLGERGKLID